MSALDRAKDLAKKTNATVMVVNETTNDVFVVMTIDQYEKLVSGSTSSPNKTGAVQQGSTEAMKQGSTEAQKHGSNETIKQESIETQKQVNTEPPIATLTEQELLARMSEQVQEWRSAQVNREQLVLAEMPANVKISGTRDPAPEQARYGAGKDQGKYNLSGKVDFRVDNLEEEERFFLDDLG